MAFRKVTILALLLATSSICFGQAEIAAETPGRHYEAWGGFSKLRGDFGSDNKATGWTGGFTVRFNRYLGVDATASGNYETAEDGRNTSIHTLLLEPRITVPFWRVSLFAHGGIGAARWLRAGYSRQRTPNSPGTSTGIDKTVGIGDSRDE